MSGLPTKLSESIYALTQDDAAQRIADRRHFHQNPELSWRETQTSAYIQEALKAEGIEFSTGWGKAPAQVVVAQGLPGNGIRAIIRSTASSLKTLTAAKRQTVALRADMDALPIQEETGLEFASSRLNVMHACGHDAHSAMLLSAARVLARCARDGSLPGDVVLLFQPAEESSPGGAASMVAEGALQSPNPRTIFGQHVNPAIPAGSLGFRSGLFMAGVDDFEITIMGRGGHAAIPHALVDPVPIAAHLILALQNIVSRQADPFSPTVVSIGRVQANGSLNVIPDEVKLGGTIRTTSPDWKLKASKLVNDIAHQVCETFGAKAEVKIILGYPPVINDASATEQARKAAIAFIGESQVLELPPVMWAEDFAYYGRATPACFYNLGTGGNTPGSSLPLHNCRMTVDEASLQTGAGFLAWLACWNLSA